MVVRNYLIPTSLARFLAVSTFFTAILLFHWSALKASLVAYLFIFFDDGPVHGRRFWPRFARLPLWRWYVPKVLNIHLHPECGKLDANQKYIFAAHPHGIFAWQHYATFTDGCGFLTQIAVGVEPRVLVASVLLWCPFIRDFVLWLGGIDASRPVAEAQLRLGRSLVIFTGGEHEQLLTEPCCQRIVLRKRKGFLRMALQHGAHIVPIYAFGENELYRTCPKVAQRFRLWLARRTRLPLLLFWGRWGTPWPDTRHPIHVVIGTPIPVTCLEETPSDAQVLALQEQVIDAFRSLFERNKHRFGYGKQELLII
ncbi:hypothetical protein CCYA_CCYA02G0686 [Cyanidiococcus yangmingshanensis]|nr:hypothetical protein CCYA_CCYA02G0686 [Cyanidiococcus yangmingshanensis]